MKKTLRKLLKGLLCFAGGLATIIVCLVLFIWIKSPVKADPIVDSKGETIRNNISLIEKVELGGQEQF